MIIDVPHGEVRLNGKIVKCGTGTTEDMRIKLRKKRRADEGVVDGRLAGEKG